MALDLWDGPGAANVPAPAMRLPFVTSLANEERSALIAARRERSLFWRLVHQGASLRLAVVLLLTLALACAVATFTESRFDAEIARHYIYRASWFLAWLGVLCLNLLCVTLDRWPWQKRHLPFVITHYGIITLLVGAAVGSRFGYEAFLSLEKGAAPEGRVVLNRNIVMIQGFASPNLYEIPFSTATKLPDAAHPRLVSIPEAPADKDLVLKIDDYTPSLSMVETLVPAKDGGPGLGLRFESAMMSQNVPLALLRDSDAWRKRSFFGLATVEWAPSLDGPADPAKPTLRLTQDGEAVRYRIFRDGAAPKEGTLLPGIPTSLGWADWRVTLDEVLPDARIERNPSPAKAASPDSAPAIRAVLFGEGRPVSDPVWIPSGTSQTLPNPYDRDRPVAVGFGLQTKPLPFAVELVSFDVPRDEGGGEPSDFVSTLRFYDLRGKTTKAVAHMNYPATYPEGFWLSALGLNYKFSQANWDPENLDRTTLQVLHDPGWPFKWIGSILIVLGVAAQFYGRPSKP